MAETPLIDGLPVWNMLDRNERAHAISALTTLRECLEANRAALAAGLPVGELTLSHPSRAVRDARLTLSSEERSFCVTHGKHKLFSIQVADTRLCSPPSTLRELDALIDAWEEAMRRSTNADEQRKLKSSNDALVFPAVAAASRFDNAWSSVTVIFGCEPNNIRVILHSQNSNYASFTSVEEDVRYDSGRLSPDLLQALLKPRPYIAIYGSQRSRRSPVSVEFGQRNIIRVENNLSSMENLRSISVAIENGWELIRKDS